MLSKIIILFSLICVFFISSAGAGEPLFGYVYTTDLIPQGRFEIEQRITDRHGQAGGKYDNLEMRSEIEYGITDDFQAALYANYRYINADGNDSNGQTSGLDIPASHNPNRPYKKVHFDSVSAEFIYRLLSPYKDSIGLALYIEPEIGEDERAVEGKLILQKNFIDDRLILAANLWVEFEEEKQESAFGLAPGDDDYGTNWAKHSVVEFDLGASYRFAPNWFAGVEYRNHNEFTGHRITSSEQEHSAHFAGPNIHYGGKKFFATLTILAQLDAKGYSQEQRANMKDGKIYGDEHTKLDGIRLIVGMPF